jgi:dephospho-CoA kinase
LIVGITGGIGSGKSTVAKIFGTLGVPIYDADSRTKILMNTNATIQQELVDVFGTETYTNGALNRKYLADIVFHNKEKLQQLNAIVHPYSIADSIEWAKAQQGSYVIKEAALMFETASFHHVDYIIGVTAPLAVRIHRTMQRDNCTREDVLARMSKQIDDSIKMKLCDAIIYNDEQQAIIPQIVQLHQVLQKI